MDGDIIRKASCFAVFQKSQQEINTITSFATVVSVASDTQGNAVAADTEVI